MNSTATIKTVKKENFSVEMYIDSFNKRVRVEDYLGNLQEAILEAEAAVNAHQSEKLIFRGRAENYAALLARGFQCEAIIDGYFLGSDQYFFCKYYSDQRRTSGHWITEDSIVKNVLALERNRDVIMPPSEYKLIKITHLDAEKLAALYREVFQIYPTPLHDPAYIKKTIQEGTIYYAFQYGKDLVSAASAEVNLFYKNAELTDCATLPSHRKHGLMKILLEKLEEDLQSQEVFCAYSIARALSFGMNAVLHQLGYKYRGRLLNNCYIFDKLENMNVWVKDLAASD
ncbi:putative beta-lysine N-acetyltransferase [Bacillus sp. ISL-47]|uniref:putative beta-lysine N-acetyltransferase n=1 Tax=Bacillus sp. ISL-47 TaxID=2819130 RepID=UPI001BE996A0|nr:putative beta-lysine N-acetyltransferase [Bacillus sp. ISL-47]MBT2690242.1 putative beta-lysine N-acetyltransferase [Bacillus sp. ISL-47]MBT2708993.1 putative beta-lysine N-acetyltransferase [Pseudomonas sp. ISL-84]